MAAAVCLVSSYFADVHAMHLTRVLSVSTLSVPVVTLNPTSVFQLGWEKGRVQKKLGTKLGANNQNPGTILCANDTESGTLLCVNDQNLVLWAIDENMGINLQAFYKHFYIGCLKTQKQQLHFEQIFLFFYFF